MLLQGAGKPLTARAAAVNLLYAVAFSLCSWVVFHLLFQINTPAGLLV